MGTITVCAICGGMRAAPETPVKGTRCTCPTRAPEKSVEKASSRSSSSGSPSTVNFTDSRHGPSASANANGASGVATASVGGTKICCVCKVNVTDKKRMKDSATGRYWCYDCYVAEQRKSGGMTMRCPHCLKDFTPARMVKHGEAYWCDACDAELDKGKKKKTGDAKPAKIGTSSSSKYGSDEPASKKLYIVGGVVAVIAAAYWFFIRNP